MSAALPILTYHAIDTSGSVLSTDPAWFTETLAKLHEAGFCAVDLADWIARGRPEIARGFALTFDDGLRSILGVAELVARFHFRATVFLVTDRMGGENAWQGQHAGIPHAPLLAWSDLSELAWAGFAFASHTRSHRRLDRCDDMTLDDELRGSRDILEQRLGHPCRLLAYPYGAASRRVLNASARVYAASFGTRLDYATRHDPPHSISRIDAYYLRSYAGLRRLVSGKWRGSLHTRRVLRQVRGAAEALRG